MPIQDNKYNDLVPGETPHRTIGLATGPVSVEMIGMKIPKYCVFGETVNLATAMEERSQGNKRF